VIKCPFCGAMQVPNTLFCSECGPYLFNADTRSTDPLNTEELGWVGEQKPGSAAPIKESRPRSILLEITETGREINVPLNQTILLGRIDPNSDVYPDVDLTIDGGANKGVSRRHAQILIRDREIVVEDLGSINGTFVNGDRLSPYLPVALNHGDQLQLGKLLIHVQLS